MSEHVREHRSLLAAAEKRLLIRIASHLPLSIHSDHLTVLALAAMALAGLGFWLARWDNNWLWVVVGALAIASTARWPAIAGWSAHVTGSTSITYSTSSGSRSC